MSKKEVEYSFAIGGALSPSFKAAVTGAKNEFTGLAKRIQELQSSDTNKLGRQFFAQKENIKNLSAELSRAKEKLSLLQSQSKGAGKDTKFFQLQVQEAEKEVNRLSGALDRNIISYQKNAIKIRDTQGSVHTLAAEYAKLSAEMQKANTFQNRYRELQAKRDSLQAKHKSLRSTRSTIQAEMLQTAVPAFALSVPIKEAVEFEAAMADVAKTMDGMRDDDGKLTQKYYAMEQAVKNMARQIPLSHAEIASLFAAAGQQGLTELSDIQEFVTMSAQMAVAFGISQEQAADAIGGYRASLGLSFEETRSMLDLMNQFANTSSATEQDIAEVVRRVGALGQQAGVTAKTMASMTANLVSMKIQPEIAATGIKNLLLALTAGEAATKSQSEAFAKLGFDTVQMAKAMQKDAPTAIQKLLATIQKLPQHEQLSTLNELFGTQSIASVSSFKLDVLAKNLGIMADESKYAGAMQKEFEARCKTTAGQLQILKNKTGEVAINIGTALLPALNSTIASVSPLVTSFAKFAQENPEVIKYTVGTAGALLGLKMTALASMYAVNGLRTVLTMGKFAVTALQMAVNRQTYSLAAQKAAMIASALATKTAAAGLLVFNAVIKANPIVRIVTLLGMAGSAMYALYQTCEPVRNAFDLVFSGIASFIQGCWEKLQGFLGAARSVAQSLGLIDDDAEITLTENKETAIQAALKPMPEFPAASAAGAVANPTPFFPASAASEEFISQLNTTNQTFSNAQHTEISIPMNFEVRGLDEKEFRRQMEYARPDFEEIIKGVMEKVSHEKARISFAN